MANKTKITSLIDTYPKNIGLFVMSLATVVGMLKASDHIPTKYVLPSQMVKVNANDLDSSINNPIQREKDDLGFNYVSYTQAERTAPRSGKY